MPDLRRQFRTVVAGAEQPDRRQRRIVGHRHHVVVGMPGREVAGLPQHQFLQPLEEIVALAAVEPAAQRVRGGAVGARRAAEAKIDPAGKQRLQHLEALGHHQRRMVGQHHAAGADADVPGHRGDLPDHQVGRGARDRRQIVVFGQPVADIAERVGMARQVDAVAQRRRRPGAGGDDGKVEDGERDHAANLVCRTGPTKGALMQIRRASAALPLTGRRADQWDENRHLPVIRSLPTWPEVAPPGFHGAISYIWPDFGMNAAPASFLPLPNSIKRPPKFHIFYRNWAISHSEWAVWRAPFGLF